MSSPPIKFPKPQLAHVDNQTPFPHTAFFKMAPGRKFHDVIVVRGTFDLVEGRVVASDEQANPILSDLWWDESNAERSSLKEVGDTLLYKPGTDVFVTGAARPHKDQALERWSAGVVVANEQNILLRHYLELTGPRHWQYSLFRGWHLSAPVATDNVPLRYELAYGGAYAKPAKQQSDTTATTWETYKLNPCGTGFFDERNLNRSLLIPGPQIETPSEPVRSINKAYPLSGFGPLARFWHDRARFAGTYDDEWRQQFNGAMSTGEAPDFPDDFDLRFYQCAPKPLISDRYLRGNERIALGSLMAEAQHFSTSLPGLRLQAHLLIDRLSPSKKIEMNLDTVHLDLDTKKLNLCWRLCLAPELGIRAIALHVEPTA